MIQFEECEKCYICQREFNPNYLYDITVEGVGNVPITQNICGNCLKDNPVEKILKSAMNEYIANKEVQK